MNRQNITLPQTREETFVALYKKVFPSVAGYIAKKGGSLDDAKDVFHDSLIIYYEKFLTKDISADNEPAYLMGVAKHIWLKKFNDNKQTAFIGDEAIDITDNGREQFSSARILNYLEKAGQKCLNLLKAFYYDNMPLQDVAQQFGFSGTRSATVQKFKCLEKVRDTVKQKQLHYEDFVE